MLTRCFLEWWFWWCVHGHMGNLLFHRGPETEAPCPCVSHMAADNVVLIHVQISACCCCHCKFPQPWTHHQLQRQDLLIQLIEPHGENALNAIQKVEWTASWTEKWSFDFLKSRGPTNIIQPVLNQGNMLKCGVSLLPHGPLVSQNKITKLSTSF